MQLKNKIVAHDWEDDYSPRVLMERIDLIKELMVLPQTTLHIVLGNISLAKRVKITLLIQAFIDTKKRGI